MVELKKELPEIFEEFAEQRKNSFLAIKEVKEKEIPVVGVFCTYLPREIPNAMGAAVVGLCSVSDETIPDAEKDLPRNLCPLIKSSYGFAKTDKCPFFYFSDLVVGETTCDGKKKMYEMLADFKPVHVVELPNCQTEDGIQLYKKELLRFKKVLEDKFETTITDEAVLHQIKLRNGINKAYDNSTIILNCTNDFQGRTARWRSGYKDPWFFPYIFSFCIFFFNFICYCIDSVFKTFCVNVKTTSIYSIDHI